VGLLRKLRAFSLSMCEKSFPERRGFTRAVIDIEHLAFSH
jgi:hypothetical protein